MNKTAG